jgi:hypothetical protein
LNVTGYSQSVARKADEIIGGSPHVQAAMTEVLHEAGITDELLAERIWEGLNATIVSKKTKHAMREVLVDYRERREMVELAYKLKGHLVQKHEIGGPDGGPILPEVRCIRIEFVKPKADLLTSNSNSGEEQTATSLVNPVESQAS